ncbi:MAG TPA: aspartate aminotransferase family protein [Candidatus Brocadiia bacterium]|nr:aspartate aminotransferase family protein [Candidatus Brocadiia bacterium]
MNTQEVVAQFQKYVVANYGRNPICFVRGEGVYVWDLEGRRYLDLFPGWATTTLGHCHPRVVAAVREQAGKLIHVDNTFYMLPQGRLAQLVSEHSFGGQCFFCNSGAEANEAAIKLTRLNGSDSGRFRIITFSNSFHGRTMATVTATAQPKYHKGFAPMVEGFDYAPFDDLDAVKALVGPQTAGIMLEPIQGEGGINVPSMEFMKGLRKLCDDNGMLLIFDEVQTGIGRTGHWFGYQYFGVEPDIMSLAKALGGGVAIGCMVARTEIARKLVPGTHASTFGGNPLACAAGIAVMETIEEEGLLEKAKSLGAYAMAQLRAMAAEIPIIKEVRGAGLMIGAQLTVPGADIFKECLQDGVRINCTHDTVIRLMPPMIATESQIDEGLAVLKKRLAARCK